MIRWAAAVAMSALALVGCGPYYEEAEYPQQYQYVAPPPPSAEELAAQQEARAKESAENKEVLIGADDEEYSDTDPSALTEFKPALDGHGSWVDDGTYGTVWVPAASEVGTDFQPYVSAGHWTYADDTDYVWVSDYSWGWAPFHYGRWVLLPGHGWSWIPGRRYAGAWVSWRTGPTGYGYVGWAPLGPSWYWYRGSAIGWSFSHYHYHDHYVYCPHGSFYQGSVSTHVVRGPAAREHYGRTQDYVPASPSVSGGGNGRVLANPSVNGAGRTVATPSINRGPRPNELGMNNDTIVAPPKNNLGIDRAQRFANPRTAVTAGAAAPNGRGPASANVVPRAAFVSPPVGASPRVNTITEGPSQSPRSFGTSNPSFGSSNPSYASPGRSTFVAPPQTGPSRTFTQPSPSFGSRDSFTSRPSFSQPSPSVRSQPPMTSFRPSSPSVSSTPNFRSSPSVSAPSSPSGRNFANGPAIRTAPRSSPSVSSPPSSNSIRSASPTVRGSFRRR